MKKLLNPLWIFIVNTIPVLVLCGLAYSDFSVIKTLLKPESIALWKNFSIALFVLWAVNVLFAGYLIFSKKTIPFYLAVFNLVVFTAYLYLYIYYSSEILPFDIPAWMLSGDLSVYVITFLMPVLAYSLFVLVVHFTPENKDNSALVSFFSAVAVPFLGYLFSQLGSSFWRLFSGGFETHILMILFVSGTLLFLFFLIRTIYIIVSKKSDFLRRFKPFFLILICVVFPVLGLLVNQGIIGFGESYSESERGIFGDFSGYWFYALAVANGVLLLIPNVKNRKERLLLFFLRMVTLAFSLYFFLVFLPLLPLSVVAIIAVGLGFLMLTPLVLFIVHNSVLYSDFTFLKKYYSPKILVLTGILGFLVLPVSITVQYYKDRQNLNGALEYLYSPDYSKEYHLDSESLKNTVDVLLKDKEKRRDFIFENGTPYLSSYYRWLVLDNLTLSDKKLNEIQSVFFNEKTDSSNRFGNTVSDSEVFFDVSKITSSTEFLPKEKMYKTWVDFEIKNNTESDAQQKFSTVFKLPNSAFISNYYLEIEGRKEYGILAEKKSAMWVFNQIVNYRKDPGILFYDGGNYIAFEIFPFVKNETRKTGIEFIHREPLTFGFENQKVELGKTTDSVAGKNSENYVSANEKKTLKPVLRKPYFCFLVDASNGTKASGYRERIAKLKNQYPQFSENSEIFFVNSYVKKANPDWSNFPKNSEGSFFLDRAVRKNLVESYQKKQDKFPVLIAVTDNFSDAVLQNDFADLEFAFPEHKFFYELNSNGNLNSHSLLSHSFKEAERNVVLNFETPVLEYRKGSFVEYLENNNEPDIIAEKRNSSGFVFQKEYESAMQLYVENRNMLIHPETSEQEWLNSVKHSFQSGIMMPYTSYISVENEAQKQALLRKQKQVLNADKNLDLEEETRRMPEPEWYVLAVLFLFFVWLYERRKGKFATSKINRK
ncbi:MAG: MSEP-CTERM sorting domain-containing protein [Bergeyella sp.]